VLTLVLPTILSLAVYPLNPIREDTIQTVNAHIAVGVTAPNGVVDAGPELSARVELSIAHPFIVRSSIDFRAGSVSTNQWPDGYLMSTTFSTDLLYYRGTDQLTAYFGVGVLYSLNAFNVDQSELDSLFAYDAITDVRYENNVGFRISIGLRFQVRYSVEIAFSRTKAGFIYDRRLNPTMFAFNRREVSVSDARISIGYIIPLRK
jgi:hypothetical protein